MGNRSDFHPTQLNSILLYTCLGEEFATWTAGVFQLQKFIGKLISEQIKIKCFLPSNFDLQN
jgi:hypothetical protein